MRIAKIMLVLLLCCWPLASQGGVVLLYHHISSSTPAVTSTSPEDFLAHLDIIQEEGFTVLPLEELVEAAMAEDADPAAKRVAITFDDAYRSIYETAFPILQGRGLPFTIFVATDYIRDGNRLYLGWDELKAMQAGGATIANHTRSHAHLLRRLPDESRRDWRRRIRAEIVEAGELLRGRGFDNPLFAYPYGEYDLALLELVEELGLIGFGQQSGAISRYASRALLPRFPLSGIYANPKPFRNKLNSLGMPVEFPRVEPVVEGGDNPPTLELRHDIARPSRLNCFTPGKAQVAIEKKTIEVSNDAPLPPGRNRYNCTLPSSLPGKPRYHWFSQMWMVKTEDGSWYEE